MVRFFAPFVVAGLSASIASPGTAQEPVAPAASTAEAVLSVEEAVRLAVRNNPRFAAARADVEVARLGVRAARALTNPNALLSPGITSVSGSGEEFLIQQPLEVNGTRQARTRIAQAEQNGVQAQAVATLRELVFQTKSAYYDLARAQRQAVVARELLTNAQEADRIARRQVEEGSRPGIDLAQTGIEVSRVRRQVTLAERDVATARAALNTLLGRGQEQPVGTLVLPDVAGVTNPLTGKNTSPVPPLQGEGDRLVPPPVSSTAPLSLPGTPTGMPPGTPPQTAAANDAVLTQAISARAEVQSAVTLRERLRGEAALARAEGRPDLAPQFRVGYFTRGLQAASEGNGAGIGLGITLPLLDYGSRRNRIRQAEQGVRAQEARIVAAQNAVREEVVTALARQQAADAILLEYRGGVLASARRLLDASRIGFQEGRLSVVALLEAQRSYLAVQTEYNDSLAEAALARAALERATGALPTSLFSPLTP